MNAGRAEERLESLAMEITDEVRIDWEREVERSRPDDRLRALQLIEEVMRAHGSLEIPPDPAEAPLFRWGNLEARRHVATGGFGEVYRAYDPRLQRTVALKLRRDDAPGTARRWVEEARSLARVKHPHVLTVYGADVHDDRAGIETEWIEGVTLEQWIGENGPASAAEARAMGGELCRALAAVHRAGLVHGDVKAENVMRERGGRLVLMDFGSAGSGAGHSTGTPLYCAPEVLNGHAASVRSDVFSLGALLYRLASGADPFPADTIDELRETHRTGAVTSLSSLRPELPADFTRAVSRAISVDPAERPGDPATLEALLRPAVESSESPRHVRSWLPRALIGILFLLLASLVVSRLLPSDPLIDVQQSEFVRVAGGLDHVLPDHAELRVGDHLAYRFAADETLYLYVLNEDTAGDTFILFPAPHVDLENPLAGGRVHRLPGTRDGQSFDWVVTSSGGPETFLVVAAREPVALLETELARMETAGPGRVPGTVRLGEDAVRNLRGIGGMAPTSDTGAPGAGRLARIATELQGPLAVPGIWVQAWSVGPRR